MTFGHLFFVLSFFTFSVVEPHSNGAPEEACGNLTPGHGLEAQKNDESIPVTCTANLDSMMSGEQLTLIIKGKSNRGFRGFVIQAQDEDGKPLGEFKFSGAARAQCLKCRWWDTCGSITHKNAGLKRRVVTDWRSPGDYKGTVQFKYSIVTSYDEYWVNVNGPTVKITK